MRTHTRTANTELIIRYYDGCSAGDLDELRATLHPDVVHYFLAPNPGSAPVAGAEHLARYWRKVARYRRPVGGRPRARRRLRGGHRVDDVLPARRGDRERVATRGAEWFVFRDGLIVEIRSYYQQRPQTSELHGFPYGERRFSVLGAERSCVHEPAAEPGRAGPE